MDDSSDRRAATREERERIGEAIRRARGRLTQAALGALIGEAQTTISRWENGEVDVELGQARRIEAALGLPAGWIGRAAGFVDLDGLAQDDPDDAIRICFYGSYEEARDDVDAAARLGLGVRLVNRLVPDSHDEVFVEQWVVTLFGAPEERLGI